MSTVLLVDGDNVAMRALHAAREQMDHEGVNTGPLVIFMNILSRVISQEQPERILIAFDEKDDTSPLLRKVFYPPYKGNRKPHPDQGAKEDTFILVRTILDLLRVPNVSLPLMEADDLIASAWALERRDHPEHTVAVLSGDKDLLQLADEKTTILRPTLRGLESWGPLEIVEKYGVPASALAAYLAVVGDSSDNVPGVRGVGPKKAAKILSEADFDFRRMVNTWEDAWGPEKVGQAEISYVLVDLVTDPLVEPGVVQAEDFPAVPEADDLLVEFLDMYGLSRLREKVEDGTLWGARLSLTEQMVMDDLEVIETVDPPPA